MTAFRILAPLLLCLGLAAGFAAESLPPDPSVPASPAPVEWHLPPGSARVPVVLLLEEPDLAAWTGRSPWIDWFLKQGIAVGQVRIAGDRHDWLDGACPLNDAQETRTALAMARREQPRIDTGRFALLGGGRQGTEALTSARALAAEGTMPAAVFALYPGCAGQCPLDYTADGPSQVHVFYGSNDDWGLHRGTASRCRSQAGGQIVFHSLNNAGHGFDERNRFTETTQTLLLRHQPDALATEIARSTVMATLVLAWQIDN